MSETVFTKRIKVGLYYYTKAHLQGVYGAFEVACGTTLGYGSEFVDFMTMDSTNVFRCYEIKVSKSDLKSPAKWSFYGDYNYFVVPEELAEETLAFLRNMGETRYGIIVVSEVKGKLDFYIKKKPVKQRIGIDQRIANMHNMVRSGSRYTTKFVDEARRELWKDEYWVGLLKETEEVSDEEWVEMFGHHKDYA